MSAFTNRSEEIKAAVTAAYQAMALLGLCGTAADRLADGSYTEAWAVQTASNISNATEIARELVGKALDALETVEQETRSSCASHAHAREMEAAS